MMRFFEGYNFMPISSMTGFSKTSETAGFGSLDCELRSVNHRYCEVSIRLPELFRSLEVGVRTYVQKALKRGKIDVTVQLSPSAELANTLVINDTVLKQLAEAVHHVQKIIPDAKTNTLDVLRWHQVTQSQSVQLDDIASPLFSVLEKAMQQLVQVRDREGLALQEILVTCADHMVLETQKIKARIPSVIAHERKRILDRFHELSLAVDQNRLEQEMVWLMQKADIVEELQRISVHIDEVHRVLAEGGAVGRRLDFLMQELNREVNTIASKSIDVETTQSTVEMKVLIEQMREQVQNIE